MVCLVILVVAEGGHLCVDCTHRCSWDCALCGRCCAVVVVVAVVPGPVIVVIRCRCVVVVGCGRCDDSDSLGDNFVSFFL